MNYGLIGEHLGHSFSKIIHNELADYDYELCEVAPDEFQYFITEKDFKAINITIPYKQTVIPYLDYISDEAKEINAVNVVVNKDGKLYGYNSDLGGLLALIDHMELDLSGKKVLIAGAGGTSHTAYVAAKRLKAREVYRLSRTGKDGAITYEEAYEKHADAEILINTTPAGMFPRFNEKAVNLDYLPKLEGVVDAVYNPLRTKLVIDAKNRGIVAEGGLYMLVMQAVLASEMFIDTKYDANISKRIFNQLLKEKENIVLIGMPASGKTTVGKVLARELNRTLIDTDEEIVKRTGMSIPDIFSKKGEEGFRKIESDIIARLAKQNGTIISTGGGAILNEENVESLKLNGKLFFLDRPLNMLVPTDSRPLSSSYEALKNRYEERYDKYLKAADVIVTNFSTVNETAEVIKKGFLS